MAIEKTEGTCVVCDLEYTIKQITHWDDGYGDSKHEWQQCPECKYNPALTSELEERIKFYTEITLRANNLPSINSEKVIENLVSVLKKYWPT